MRRTGGLLTFDGRLDRRLGCRWLAGEGCRIGYAEAGAEHRQIFAQVGRVLLGEVFKAIRQLMADPPPPKKRHIGF